MKTEKQSFKQWCEHIWYYNKWMIILGGTVAVFLIVGVIQLFTQKEGDVSFLYVGKATITVRGTNELQDTVKGLIEDYNDDGVITIDYVELTALAGETSGVAFDFDTNNAVLRRFENEVRAGDSVIYLLDQYYFERVVDMGVLANLSDILGDDVPETAIDDYGVYLKDLDIYSTPGFNQLPAKTILCIRRSPEQDQITYGRRVDVYNANRQCFIELFNYKQDK
ncbi:MAG: hypothetical protein CVU97_01595 [Firmicutes bacterium HGW-Firmicutes-21]|nr:MAG: hypothetical protein CVU97_01595 [Firmicutes bacterium HGW-Firmicutes-21]